MCVHIVEQFSFLKLHCEISYDANETYVLVYDHQLASCVHTFTIYEILITTGLPYTTLFILNNMICTQSPKIADGFIY